MANSRGGAFRSASTTQGGSTAKQVSLDAADTSYGEAVLVSGALKVLQPGWITINAQVKFFSGDTGKAIIRVNGSTVATTASNTATATATYTYAADEDDLLTLWETDDTSGDNLSVGAANTFLHFTPIAGGNSTMARVPIIRAGLF